ncbi:outer membrane protein OmpA-like peptidoglycan-associated protein [Taibaiella chishuiensis]|uniref:Outer membrane protein OmpA-like peptidoglycan-associated protein n=2 Tax=Taibaiella chishuiensis TaxID=1434707 RepID=A0A2P8DDA4_9BACT|nr:outer membrane protein OmpA-like peptidoglycan-associated protein [Taibaiella chishuiensis]
MDRPVLPDQQRFFSFLAKKVVYCRLCISIDSSLMRSFCLFIFCLLGTALIYAQGILGNSGQRLYDKGQEYLRRHNNEKAESCFLKSIKEAPQNIDAYTALSTLYCSQAQYAKAAGIFESAAQACPKCTHAFALPLATALCRAQQFDRAGEVLARWQKPAVLNPRIKQQYEQLRANIQFGKYAMAARHTDTPRNMGPMINSRYDEYFPSVSRDDSTLVFTRKTNGVDEDFYSARRDSCGGWFTARDMGTPPNSPQQEGAQMLSADGHYLFFMRCGNRSLNGWEAGGCDLYFSYTEKEGWSQPVPFGATINTPGYEGMPSLSSDNKELFFVSEREGGYGGKDIYVSRFADGLWQVPENLGPEINTPYDETAPFISPDNKTLYFTSNGHPGLGGNDVFFSRRRPGDKWEQPQNPGYPFNTAFDEVSACISSDGKKAYLASDRSGGEGGMDLYEVTLPEEARAEPFTYVHGVVYDSLDNTRVTYAQLEWLDAATGEPVYHYQSNRGDGSYMGAIALSRKYVLHTYRAGFLDRNDTLEFTQTNNLYPDTLNIALLPRDYRPPLYDTMILKVYFAKSTVAGSDSDKVLLQHLATPYIGREYTQYFINGYTDDSGSPVINDDLSFARARGVADWLREIGVPDEQIHVQGWADANPAAPNDSEPNRYLNRRVEVTLRKP